jgi:octaprenyl-diphosphate synthase
MNRTEIPADQPAAIQRQSQMDLQTVFDLCAGDMSAVDQCIRGSLNSDVVLINQVSEYIIGSGGKRLRPMLVVLGARACGYQGNNLAPLAAIVEFIHTATLLHDDVVDESDMRRGQQTAHAVWGNAASVLVGDFLYSRSFQMMVGLDSMRIMQILSDTTNTIAEGEVQQLLNMGDPDVDEDRYLQVIHNKTAKLFEAACQLGGILAATDDETETALATFGKHLGCAFQIADDVLDYAGNDQHMGKSVGDDLAEGKPTLPLIIARNRTGDTGRQLIDRSIREGGLEHLDAVMAIILETDALNSARAFAEQQSQLASEALTALPASTWREAMQTLAGYSVNRNA